MTKRTATFIELSMLLALALFCGCRSAEKAPEAAPGNTAFPIEKTLAGERRDAAKRFDRFDLAQLREVAAVCRESRTLTEAGKKLFAVSRQDKRSVNDADRLSKYLARFGLDFRSVSG